MRPKLLFIATHPKEIASTRYRVLAYGSALQQAGFDFDVQCFFPSEALRFIYTSWRPHQQARFFARGILSRWRVLRGNAYNLVFIHRELFPWGMTLGMRALLPQLERLKCCLIYDFDDAVYLPHRQNRFLISRLEDPSSVDRLISMSDQVIAGNPHLADYASRLNPRVRYIPTPIDTNWFYPMRNSCKQAVLTIGWIGTPSTVKYLLGLGPVFKQLSRRYSFHLKIIGSDRLITFKGVTVENRPWNLLHEADEFRRCDIGVYPLWDDEWSRGKCGFKALQFMASGVPVVASSIGVNQQIIQDRSNGFLVRTPEEWTARLSELLEDSPLRRSLGLAGRQTIEERYSLARVAPQFIETIQATLDSREYRASTLSGCVRTNDVQELVNESQMSAADRHPILCFSSIDWDFVWQGHQEIMSTLAQQGHQVLFIENTGVRNPRFRDLPRIRHRFVKWRQSLQGFRQEKENLHIFSPLVFPFPYSRIARWINRRLLVSAIRQWMDIMNFHQPVCWAFLPTPTTLEVIDKIPYRALIYYRIDSFVDSTPAAQRIASSEQKLLQQADLVFVTSEQLLEKSSQWNSKTYLFPFGVNFRLFEEIRMNLEKPPEEFRTLRTPIVGYVGGIHRWVDQELVCRVARLCPTYSFVFIGPIQTSVERLKREPNIFFFGQKLHEQLPHYLKCFDVGIIPYRLTDYTSNVYPTKLNEYHAMGKPVVSTPLPEIIAFNQRFHHLVQIGATDVEFQRALERALQDNGAHVREQRILSARENSWSKRIDEMQHLVRQSISEKVSRPVHDWSKHLVASQQSFRFLSRIVAACALFYVMIFQTPLVWFLAQPLMAGGQARPADAIVVFAGGVGESGQVSENYQNQVKQAVELYRQGYAPRILFISGYTWVFREADIMRVLAVSLGVPSSAVSIETEVHNAHDYVLRVKRISDQNRWKSILVVAPIYHGRRAQLTFARNAPGLTIVQLPAQTGYYDHTWRMKPSQLKGIVHEVFGIFYYWWKGWI